MGRGELSFRVFVEVVLLVFLGCLATDLVSVMSSNGLTSPRPAATEPARAPSPTAAGVQV